MLYILFMDKKIRVLLTLDQELVDRLDLIAKAAEMPRSRSWLIRRIVNQWLADTPFEQAAALKVGSAVHE